MDTWWDNFRSEREGPKYMSIVEGLADAIQSGRFEPGRRLPSHRLLARKLGVSVGTVTRAYQEALDMGLITGSVGRGSFVSHHPTEQLRVVGTRRTPVACLDLVQNLPLAIPEVENQAWQEALAGLRHNDLATQNRRSWSKLSTRHRKTGAIWMARTGLGADPSRIFDCPGTITALCAIFGAATRPGDLVLTATLSHPIVKMLAEQYSLKIHGLAMDEQGIEPDAFEVACRETSPALIYCAPTIHSPTTKTMSDERRRAIAGIAKRHDVLIVEDESAAFLLSEPILPISAHAPERSFFLADVWMALSLGLRTAYVLAPEKLLDATATAVATTCGVTPPLIAEIASRWIRSDVADRLIEYRRAELTRRNADARRILRRGTLHSDPCGHNVWLELPEPWRSDLFVLHAENVGVSVGGAEWFAVGHGSTPEAVRLCIGNAPRRDDLADALEQLNTLMAEPQPTNRPSI